jgi:hypothetical protein
MFEKDELFDQLSRDDPDMKEAMEIVEYRSFKSSVPNILLLEEFVDTIYRKAVSKDDLQTIWFCERYIKDRYLYTNVESSEEYRHKTQERLIELSNRVSNVSGGKYTHLMKFIDVIIGTLYESNKLLTKETLEYLNKVYKGKVKF